MASKTLPTIEDERLVEAYMPPLNAVVFGLSDSDFEGDEELTKEVFQEYRKMAPDQEQDLFIG